MMFSTILYFFYFVMVNTPHDITNHSKATNTNHIHVENEEAVLIQWQAILRENER